LSRILAAGLAECGNKRGAERGELKEGEGEAVEGWTLRLKDKWGARTL